MVGAFARIIVLAVIVAVSAAGAAQASGGGESEEGKASVGPLLMRLPPVSAPILRDGRVRGTINLALILDIAEDVPIADIEHGLPRIEAAMLDLLVRYANSTPSHDQLVNLNQILARFQKIVDRYAGAGNARLLVHAATQLRKR